MCPDAKLTKENKIEIEIGSTSGESYISKTGCWNDKKTLENMIRDHEYSYEN
jgi:hypothetical protein